MKKRKGRTRVRVRERKGKRTRKGRFKSWKVRGGKTRKGEGKERKVRKQEVQGKGRGGRMGEGKHRKQENRKGKVREMGKEGERKRGSVTCLEATGASRGAISHTLNIFARRLLKASSARQQYGILLLNPPSVKTNPLFTEARKQEKTNENNCQRWNGRLEAAGNLMRQKNRKALFFLVLFARIT